MAEKKNMMTSGSAGEVSPTPSSGGKIDSFLSQARQLGPVDEADPRARLIFALDATMSRQPTWDLACKVQAQMFEAADTIGGLAVQLIYFRGFDECRASKWVIAPSALTKLMTQIDCRGGHTQIGKIIAHAKRETQVTKVQALVFVGDAMEEKLDHLCHAAGELGLLGVPAFMFQEGGDPITEQAFREIARLTRGAYCRFDPGAAHQLAELLRAAAAYAAGGMRALADLSARHQAGALKLLEQMRS